MLPARAWTAGDQGTRRFRRRDVVAARLNIVPFQKDGEPWMGFEVHPLQNDRSVVVRHEPVLEQRGVRNTSGISETRYVIREQLVLGEQRWLIELTLTNRDAMGYRMLLGREAMVGRVLVDLREPSIGRR